MEFLTHITVELPTNLSPEEKAKLGDEERARSAELAAAGIQKRLWRDPGRRAVWALWEAEDATKLHDALSSLAFWPWMQFDVYPLAQHPGDPAGK